MKLSHPFSSRSLARIYHPHFLAIGLFGCLINLGTASKLSAANAQIFIYCDSVRFHGSEATVGDTTYFLEVGSPPFDTSQPNGDLAPFDVKSIGVVNTLGSLYIIRTPGETFFDDFFLPTPDYSDTNANGVDDFFEPEIGLTGVSSMGFIEDGVQETQFPSHATWYRDPSKTSGICRVLLQNAN